MIVYLLSVWMIACFSILAAEKALSQTNPRDTASQVTADGAQPYVKGVTAGRARALLGAAAGLVSLVAGWWARRVAKRGGSGRTGAMAAVVFGLTGIILSLIHLTASAGAVFGSGSGKAGAIVALVLSGTGLIFGWLALRRKGGMRAGS